jgi:rod shape-determining protein MreD
MFRMAYFLIPAAITLLVALGTCLPWGAPAPVQFALPLLTMAVIFYWSVNRRRQLPSPVVFFAGLFTDLATAGPLGYWALNFLISVAIASYGIGRFADRRSLVATTVMFAVSVAVVSAAGWLLSSLFLMRAMPYQSLAEGALIATAAYPALAYFLRPFDRMVDRAQRAANLRGLPAHE